MAIIYTLQKNPDSIWRFPSTELGSLLSRLLSLPVSILHIILARTGIEIPIYLGLLISVPTLLLTWGFLVGSISKYVGTRRESPSQSRENHGTPEFFLRYKVTDGVLLGLSTAVAVLIRAIPLIIGSMPTGFDTAYYIGTLQSSEKLRWPETAWHRDTPIAYLIFTVIGAALQITQPLPAYQVKFVELLPVAFHAISALAVYGLVKEATKSSRSAVLASFLTSSAFSQLRMSFDLYKNIIGIAVLAFCFMAYLLLIRERGKRHFAVMLILLCSLLGIHPYPALILILTLSTYALGTYLLSYDKGERKSILTVTLTLFLAAAVILTPLTYRFLTESPLIDEPWPHEPTTPIFRIPIFTQEGREFLLLTVSFVGLLYCSLNKTSKPRTILVIWLLVTIVLSEQTFFQVFFEAGESEKVPRFIWHLAYPNSILGAIGITQVINLIDNDFPLRSTPTYSTKSSTMIFPSIVLSLLLLLHTANATMLMSEYGPMMEESNYTAMIWLDTHSIENSGLESLYPHHMKQYLWQTHLKASWEDVEVQDLFYLRIYGSEEYDLNIEFNKVYDAEIVQLYQGPHLSASK